MIEVSIMLLLAVIGAAVTINPDYQLYLHSDVPAIKASFHTKRRKIMDTIVRIITVEQLSLF